MKRALKIVDALLNERIEDFNERPGGPGDPWRQNLGRTPEEREDEDLETRLNYSAIAWSLLSTIEKKVTPEEFENIVKQSQDMTSEEFYAYVRELLPKYAEEEPPPSRFDINFDES